MRVRRIIAVAVMVLGISSAVAPVVAVAAGSAPTADGPAYYYHS